MKQNQKILLSIGLGIVILLNIVVFGWLLTDFFSGPNGPEETVAATGSEEETTDEETTGSEEMMSTELISAELIEGQIPLRDAKQVLHTFSWGEGEGQLGYAEGDGNIRYPQAFAVEDKSLYVLDEANCRVLIYENDQYAEIDISSLSEVRNIRYQNGWIGVLGKDEDGYVTMLYQKNGSVGMTVRVPKEVTYVGAPADIVEIGDTYVVWKTVSEANAANQRIFRYSWTEDSLESMDVQKVDVSELPYDPKILGENEGAVYYSYVDEDSDVNVINCESNGYRLYTKMSYAACYAVPRNEMYFSADGHLYLMECLEDGVTISELKLGEEFAIIQEKPVEEETPPVENPPAVELVEAEVPLDKAKEIVRTFAWGAGDGQLGFYDNVGAEGTYTRAFAIEDGVIYVLDEVNRRVLICGGNQYSEIDIDLVSQPGGMVYGNGRIAIYDESKKVTLIYQKDGSVERTVEMATQFRKSGASVEDVISVGDTYVEWAVKRNEQEEAQVLRYDWVYDVWELKGKRESSVSCGSYRLDRYQSSGGYRIVRTTEKFRLYAGISDSNYPAMDGQMIYFSTDGRLYLLELFEYCAEISELKLEDEFAVLPEVPEEIPGYKVLDEYFEKREELYTLTEKPEFDPDRWQYLQDWQKQMKWTVCTAEVHYNIEKVLSETDTEVKLLVYESVTLGVVYDGQETVEYAPGSLSHIIRLVKQGEEYVITSDSCYDMMSDYAVGLEEDIELLKTRGW